MLRAGFILAVSMTGQLASIPESTLVGDLESTVFLGQRGLVS
jgi:hypothetical protein